MAPEEQMEALGEVADHWMRSRNQWEYIIGTKVSVMVEERYKTSKRKSVANIIADARKAAQKEMALAARDFESAFEEHWAEVGAGR